MIATRIAARRLMAARGMTTRFVSGTTIAKNTSATATDANTSTKIGERTIIDRVSAPGTGKNRKVPKTPVDYLDGANKGGDANPHKFPPE